MLSDFEPGRLSTNRKIPSGTKKLAKNTANNCQNLPTIAKNTANNCQNLPTISKNTQKVAKNIIQ
jgi:hypothetical protein